MKIACIAEKTSIAKDITRIIGSNSARYGYMEGNGNSKFYAILAVIQQ